MITFRPLRADEIEIRVGQEAKNKLSKSLLLYKDARVDMRLLDEQVTPMKWQREHTILDGVLYCKVSIWDDEREQWVSRMDAGEKTKVAADKGQASDAFKRACANWGIGRELYTAPSIWVRSDVNERELVVTHIAYVDGIITELTIANKRTSEVVYTLNPRTNARTQTSGTITPNAPKNAPAQPKTQQVQSYQDLSDMDKDLYDSACANMDFATSKKMLYGIYYEYINSPFADLLKAKGGEISKQRGW